MESKYMEFIRYDWENSEEWKNYLENIFPPPPQSRILYYKKKFYKLKVDPNFDINYIPGNNNFNQRNNERNNNNNNDNNNSGNVVFIYTDIILSVTSFLSFFIHYPTSIKLLLGYYIHNLIKNEGVPKLNQQYFNKVINNESFSCLILLILLCIDNSHNIFIGIPILFNTFFSIFKESNVLFHNFIFSKIFSFKDIILIYANFF